MAAINRRSDRQVSRTRSLKGALCVMALLSTTRCNVGQLISRSHLTTEESDQAALVRSSDRGYPRSERCILAMSASDRSARVAPLEGERP
jgi:hypothetical protein